MLPGYVRPWALASGLAGIAANLVLVLFYVLATPWRAGSSLSWLGPANDLLVLVQFGALAPVLEALRGQVGADQRGRWWAVVGLIGSAGVVVLQGLLVLGVLPFPVQVVLLAPFAVVTVWAVGAVSRAAASAGVLPDALGRFARGLALGLVAGVALLAVAGVVGAALGLGWVVWVAGSLPAVAVWFAFPFWALRLSRVASPQRA